MSLRLAIIFFFCVIYVGNCRGTRVDSLMNEGWKALVHDDDLKAITCFELAYERAVRENDTENIAESLLNLGICYYGVSVNKGLEYCFSAMRYYKKLEQSDPKVALKGRSRCLQLVSTIYSRQGKYQQCIALSREAMVSFYENDSSGYLGLAYGTIAGAYKRLGRGDSAEFYYRKALTAQKKSGNVAYISTAYIKVGDIELKDGNSAASAFLYKRALDIADSTGNRQGQVMSLIGRARWQSTFGNKDLAVLDLFKAKNIASTLNDRTFYLMTLEELLSLRKLQGDLKDAFTYNDEIIGVKDSIATEDRQRLAKSLEVQFNLAEKDRKLSLLEKEKDIALLSNYLLWASVVFILILSSGIIIFLNRNRKRGRLLLQTKEKLMEALQEQKNIREKFLQNDIEFKESQMSAMALQILQKNELMQELNAQLEQSKNHPDDAGFEKIISKGLNHEKEWTDFNSYFESINKNFYNRLKQDYPDISPNDLRICALIKLNLSIKEMAGILNISPDSVKTARYRLRKKLSLNTEDNLTEFILKI